jgi:hypothetical protein
MHHPFKLLFLACFFLSPGYLRAQLFSEQFDETGTYGNSAEGISWSCSGICNPSGIFESTGAALYCNNPKSVASWVTDPISIQGYDEVLLVVHLAVTGDIEGNCNIGATCPCAPIPNLNDCGTYSGFDFIDIGYRLDGVPYTVPDQLGCSAAYVDCDPACGAGPYGSCDVSAGGYHTYYGDCSLAGEVDDNDLNGGNGTGALTLMYTIYTYGATQLVLDFSMMNSAVSEAYTISSVVLNGTVLPVEWSRFDATKTGDDIELVWETLAEQNSDVFEVEYSKNGGPFNSISSLPAAGNASQLKQYRYRHPKPGGGVHSYRIVQRDLDGAFGYSVIRSVRMEGSGLVLYPNPATDQLFFLVSDHVSESGSYSVINAAGKACKTGLCNENGIPIADLPEGLYVLQIRDGRNLWQEVFLRN